MTAIPLPSPAFVRAHPFGIGRARAIRALYASRCNLHEIEVATGASREEIRRTLHRPVRAKWAR